MPGISYSFLDEQMTENDKIYYQRLGKHVAKLRKERQITQVQMAKALGVSQQLIAAQEAGRRKIPVSMLTGFANVLDVTLEELLGIKKAPLKRGPVSALNRKVEQIRRLPRNKQKFVMQMLDTVIQQQSS